MADSNKTNVGIRADRAIGMSSQAHGAHVDAIAFNIALIAEKWPTKAVEILNIYKEVRDITPDTPPHPDEDFGLASDRLSKTMQDIDS